MIVGNQQVGPSAVDLTADYVYATGYEFPILGSVAKLSAYLDGDGSGNGDQQVRAAVWAEDGTVFAQGEPVTIIDGQAASWVDLPFNHPYIGKKMPRGRYLFGIQNGNPSASARLHGDTTVSGVVLSEPEDGYITVGTSYATGRRAADTFSDGLTTLAAGSATIRPAIFLTGADRFAYPNLADEQYAAYAFPTAQARFSESQFKGDAAALASLGWHGVRFDPNQGSLAVVKANGALADFVGERVRIRRGRKSVFAYCYDERDIIEDISVPRRLFVALGFLSATALNVTVEVVE